MKVLHTSDWHIGRRLYDKTTDKTLALFFDWLIEIINTQKIDVLIVAGDIFNSPFPSQSAYELYYKTLYKLSKTALKQIIITGGNHDSAKTLNAPKELLKLLKISVIGGVPDDLHDLIIEIKDKENIELAVFAVPFLRDRDIRYSVAGQTETEIYKNINNGIINFYNKIAEIAKKYKQKNIPTIATGHLFVNDLSDMSDEHKKIFVGTLQEMSSSQFPDIFDYYALGHLHFPYKVGNGSKARYSGSPIHLDFSNKNYNPQVIILDIDGKINIQPLKVPIFRKLVRIEGTFDEVANELLTYSDDLPLTAWADIHICEQIRDLTMERRIDELKQKLQNIEIIRFRYNFADNYSDIEQEFEENTDLHDIQPIDVFEKLLKDLDEQDKQLMRQTFNELITDALNDT